MLERDKQYIRFKNALLSVKEIQAFTWSNLKETDEMNRLFYGDRLGEHGRPKYYKVVVFLRGGQNFVSACTKKNLDHLIRRFKRQWSDEEE
tara:strand:+ start:238 stop:510 length:273 start_codon:yes stop_codon:yes gene_type:complete